MVTLILLIHHQAGTNGKRLEKTLRSRLPETERELYDSCEGFHGRLCQPNRGGKIEIYVVLADTRARLERLVSIRKLLEGRRLVLILPENRKKTLSMGQRLLPRYVCTDAENHGELVSVLEKMIDVMIESERRVRSGDAGFIQPGRRQNDIATG